MGDSFLPDGEELTEEDLADVEFLAGRYRLNPQIAQLVRAETMNVMKANAQCDPANEAEYEAVFDLIKQEGLDAERSADRALGLHRGKCVRFGAYCNRHTRNTLQLLSRLVRRALASLPRL